MSSRARRGGDGVAGAVIAIFAMTIAGARAGHAADTVETWDVGATDVDFYLGWDGAGLPAAEHMLSGELMLGYGIVERFSAYLGASLSADAIMTGASSEVFLGVFGTPVDTAHFDLDLFLDLRAGGMDSTGFTVAPAFEMNFDLDPDMQSWGAYVMVGFPIYGRQATQSAAEPASEAACDVEATIGTYLTLGGAHQLILSYDMFFRPRPADDERPIEVGGVALGYNVVVHDAIELITEVSVGIPQGDEPVAVGFVLGFIATVPSAATAPAPTPETD